MVHDRTNQDYVISGQDRPQVISRKRSDDLATVDRMSPELRGLVHDFGLPIVNAFVSRGIKAPGTIRELIRACWDGARQPLQSREKTSMLDWVLMKSECGLTARTLGRILEMNNMAIMPVHPTVAMIEASMAECSTFQDRVTTQEKHKRRLLAALKVGAIR